MNKETYFQKSHFINNFRETFLVEKTGKEIKEKVLNIIAKEELEIVEYKTKLISLKNEIKEEPDVNANEIYYYQIEGFEDKIKEMPLIYKIELQREDSYVGEKPLNDICELKSNYNNTVFRLINCYIELVMLNTIMSSYPDNKLYKLTLKEASLLGF